MCDRMGFMVMNEAFDVWEQKKLGNDYHKYFKEWHERDLTSMVRRDRNHPCVILWSVGNEVNAMAETPSITPSLAYEVGVHKIDAVITLALDTTAIHRNDDACSSRNGAQRLKCTQEESSRRSIRNTVIAGKSGDTV